MCLVATILGTIPSEYEDSWGYVKERFYREVNRYSRELGEEIAELLERIVTCKALRKAARVLAKT